jgi:hypothetical protein
VFCDNAGGTRNNKERHWMIRRGLEPRERAHGERCRENEDLSSCKKTHACRTKFNILS